MHNEPQIVALKVHPEVADPKTMQGFSCSPEFSKSIQLVTKQLRWNPAKLTQNLQLQFLGHPRQFCGADGIEDDLERLHVCLLSSPRPSKKSARA